jgi:predicted nuclease with TOPRIM domain
MEAKKNVERRKTNLNKLHGKLEGLVEGKSQNEYKIERLKDEFLNINKTFDSPFH